MNDIKKKFLIETSKVVLGKEKQFTLSLCAFLSSGHILIEDIPGVGKTTFAKTFSKVLGLSFSRIQFTSDLMPSDILGTSIYDRNTNLFKNHLGPIHCQIVLADELNRGSPKTQSAMLEAMEEKQVTIDKDTIKLPNPFLVIATQNPLSQIGTNHLPESQLDRFIISFHLGFPTKEDEIKLIQGHKPTEEIININSLFNVEQIVDLKNEINKINLSSQLGDYIFRIVDYSRKSEEVASLSPRASIDIGKMSKAFAFLEGRNYVLPDDVKAILEATIFHRLQNKDANIINKIIKHVFVD